MNAPNELLGLVSHDAERAVLAAMRDDMAAAVDVAQKLEPGDFSDPRRQVAFEALSNLLVRPDAIDTAAIVAECMAIVQERGLDVRVREKDIDGLDPYAGRNIALQANTVKRLSWLRRYSDFAFWMVEQVQMRPDPDDLFAAAQEQLQHMLPPTGARSFWYGWELLEEHRGELRRRIAEHESGTAVPYDWPWPSWNRMVRPLRAGFVGIIAAADGMGKTSYLEQIAEHWAGNRLQTVYVHLEDEEMYKADRQLARLARVAIDHIEDGNLTAEERRRIADVEGRRDELGAYLHYYPAAGKDMQTIVRELESRVAEGSCQAVVFDYLDKVQPTRVQAQLFGNNIWERQAADVEALKTFAEKSRVPVLAATQGNKTMQDAGTITRRSIQGSGQKSQKAQLVVILTRDIVPDGGLWDGETKIADAGEYSPVVKVRIDKQNRGKTGQLQQVIIGRYFSVADMERETPA